MFYIFNLQFNHPDDGNFFDRITSDLLCILVYLLCVILKKLLHFSSLFLLLFEILDTLSKSFMLSFMWEMGHSVLPIRKGANRLGGVCPCLLITIIIIIIYCISSDYQTHRASSFNKFILLHGDDVKNEFCHIQ